MPQMAPMNWTLLFVIFITLYLITLVLIYFSLPPSNQTLSDVKQFSKFSTTWKW